MTRSGRRWIWWSGGALLVIGAAWLGWNFWVYGIYHPVSANFDPLIGSIRRDGVLSPWRGPMIMKPCCFKQGEEESVVMQRMKRSEFNINSISGWHQKVFGNYLTSSIALYSRGAGKFPCSDEFFIAVEFDSQHRLSKAEGSWINAVCL